MRLLLMVILTMYLNTVIKEWFALPRPFEVDTRIISEGEMGFSFPSGHAQLVAVFWGLLAMEVGRRWFTGVCLLVIFLTGLSRSYLGVHYPTDVMVGWLFGGLTLWAWHRWGEALERWSTRQRLIGLLLACAAMTGLAFLLGSTEMVYGSVGMGLAAGLYGLWVRDDVAAASLLKRGVRYGIGVAAMFGLMMLLQKAAAWSQLPSVVDGFVLMAVFGAVIVGLLPWLFQKVRL
nr:phosphatase PAP2 family protein [Litorivivens lipolytica]